MRRTTIVRFPMTSARASVSALALALTTTPAFAQDSAPETETAVASTDLIVIGSRRTDRTVEDSPVPIDVISGDQLTGGGTGDTNRMLNQIVPSFNFPQPSIADGTDALRPASLRGLSPDQTLVLVNGKRRHVSALLNINGTVGRGSAAVDLNTIPSLAIERIEVLRDGAASQYGSDAIAGVINIQLRRASSGGRAAASFGKYVTTLDGVANLTGVQTWGGVPLLDPTDTRLLAGDINGERRARDGDLWTYGFNVGLPIAEGGYLNLTGEYRDRARTNRAGYDLRPNYNRPTASLDARELTFDRLETIYGDAKTQDFNFFLNAGVPVGDFELYAFGSFAQRDGLSAANYRQQSAAANRDWSTISPSTTPTTANFTALTPDGFLPFIATDLRDYAATIGLRGEVSGWSFDLSAGLGHNSFDYRVENSINTSYGTGSQRTFDAGGLRYGQKMINLDVSRAYDFGFASDLSVAFGAEYRGENFSIRPGELQSYGLGPMFRADVATTAANCATLAGVYSASSGMCSFPGRKAAAGAQGFPGIPAASATDADRHSFAGYIELDVDPLPGLTATLAGRYEHYSDFGETLNGKFAVRFELVEGFALRGSVSNGFRAPSLHQQYFTTTSTNFIGGLPVDISTVAVDSPVARALGSRNLDPEKSFNLSVGATASPLRGLTLTVDLYRIKIDDRIVLTENLGAAGSGTAAVNAAVKAVLDANGMQSVGAARFFINGLDTTTEGVDIVASYRANTSLGNWTLTAAYNYNHNEIDRRINELGPLANIPNIVLFGRVEGIRFTEGQPRDKIVLTAEGDFGWLGVTARTTRYGRVIAPGSATPLGADAASLTALGPDDIVLSPKWVTDLEVRFKPIEAVNLALGVNNLFDIYPDRSPVGARPAAVGGLYPINQYYQPYSGFSPFGFNGRFLYGRVSFTF